MRKKKERRYPRTINVDSRRESKQTDERQAFIRHLRQRPFVQMGRSFLIRARLIKCSQPRPRTSVRRRPQRGALATRRTRQSDDVIKPSRTNVFYPMIALVYHHATRECTVMACASLTGLPWVVNGPTSVLITHCRAVM